MNITTVKNLDQKCNLLFCQLDPLLNAVFKPPPPQELQTSKQRAES